VHRLIYSLLKTLIRKDESLAWLRWLEDFGVLILKSLSPSLELVSGFSERAHERRKPTGAKEKDQ
tara:strand:- start:179 stop:373 length:195 start_codon:yes stop_codon:yes gene_type:complete